MKLLAKHSVDKVDHSNIIQIAGEAKIAKKSNPNVINATIGMLFSEEEEFYTFKCVKDAESKIEDVDKYAYTNTRGPVKFLEGIKNWVFQDKLKNFLDDGFHIEVMSSAGGSGAISNTFGNYLNQGEFVLLPDYMWSNYKQVAYENYLNYTCYSMFTKQGTFNVNSFKEKCLELKKSQGRILAVINDPCHNPTGYSMSYEEWTALVDVINEVTTDNTPFILLYDMAYIDYDVRGLEASRANIDLFRRFNNSVLPILAFSGSKTLGLYGLRIGAMIAVSKSKDVIDDFLNANQFSSRTKYSMCSTLGMNLIGTIFNNDSLIKSFKEELDSVRKMLIARTSAFIEEANKIGLDLVPFKCGFFVTVPCEKDEAVFEYLKNQGVYIVPVGKALRIALCSVNLEHARKLPALIKVAMENV